MKIEWIFLNPEDDSNDIFLDDDDETSEYEKHEEEKYEGGLQTKKAMITPFGLAILDNSLNPFKGIHLFQFHTDFPITQEILDTIENTPGCEILKVNTPYRGVLAVAKLFNPTDFRREVERRICKEQIPNEDIRIAAEKLKQKLYSKSQNWAIYVLPNGNCDFISENKDGSNKNQVEQMKKIYQEAQLYSHGFFIQNEPI